MKPKVVYVAGPYEAKTAWLRELNVRQAEQVGIELAAHGIFPIIPHTISRFWYGEISGDEAMRMDFNAITVVDAVVLVRGWEISRGTCAEILHAARLGKPIFDGAPACLRDAPSTLEALQARFRVEPWHVDRPYKTL